jgi:hypothetical protein
VRAIQHVLAVQSTVGVERSIQERAVGLWRQVDPALARRTAQGIGLEPRATPGVAD